MKQKFARSVSVAIFTLLSGLNVNFACATPVSASMSLIATVLDSFDHRTTDHQTASWGVPLSTLDIAASTTLDGISAKGSASATWGSGGNSGTVRFTGYELSGHPAGNDYAQSLSAGGDVSALANDWTYTFVADFDGLFSLNYDVKGSGFTYGLGGWVLRWAGAGAVPNLYNTEDPTKSGTFTDVVVAGQTYTIGLRNGANRSSLGEITTGSMDGLFQFAITPHEVPEPGSLALFGIALAWLAATRKREQALSDPPSSNRLRFFRLPW